ncbi:MAG: hypothetical protein KUG77_03220 [Nannocystaceae bacterium]|nr:hypothetical protein [Nannocystaceae bacterium]
MFGSAQPGVASLALSSLLLATGAACGSEAEASPTAPSGAAEAAESGTPSASDALHLSLIHI